MGSSPEQFTRSIALEGVKMDVSAIGRNGTGEPIVFLHGFGSTKEDYADIVHFPAFDDHRFLAYDAPGCGATRCSEVTSVTIPFLMKTCIEMLDRESIDQCHLVGHSMGGLTALMFADAQPERVLSFTSIEGNIAPEDCFLSRQIIQHPDPDPVAFFDAFAERVRCIAAHGTALYATNLASKVRPAAVHGIFTSMVELSDHGDLMNRFLRLKCPKMFMYGSQNSSLSYLDDLEANGVRLAEIPHCGHCPMYSNAPAMWGELSEFLNSNG